MHANNLNLYMYIYLLYHAALRDTFSGGEGMIWIVFYEFCSGSVASDNCLLNDWTDSPLLICSTMLYPRG